jgi:NADH:ubiquinone oxidoreductase subunit F (NADH-binding)
MKTTGEAVAADVAAHGVTAQVVATHVVGVPPGLAPRLLRADPLPESLVAYVVAEGYQDGPAGPQAATELLDAIERSGLRGRGGAAFPFAVKARTVRANGAAGGTPPVVIANGEEGEPASVKDRWLLRNRPHLVLDGLRLAAALVGADRAYLYVSDPGAARSAADALHDAELAGRLPLPVELVVVDPSYVAGEETAAVRVINGGPAKPADKPPRPFEEGVAGRPTLVSNVETLANLPYIYRHGPEAYRQAGTSASPGTFLATVTGGGRPPALYELPHGLPLRELLRLHEVAEESVTGLLMGGYFSGLLGRQAVDLTLDHESARALGSGLGCGALAILTTDECPVAVAASVMAYFARENAGQCGSCFNGTSAMSAALGALRDGEAAAADITRLRRWSQVLRGRGACGTLDGATNLAASLLAEFPDHVTTHLNGGCRHHAPAPFNAARPFEVEPVTRSAT